MGFLGLLSLFLGVSACVADTKKDFEVKRMVAERDAIASRYVIFDDTTKKYKIKATGEQCLYRTYTKGRYYTDYDGNVLLMLGGEPGEYDLLNPKIKEYLKHHSVIRAW